MKRIVFTLLLALSTVIGVQGQKKAKDPVIQNPGFDEPGSNGKYIEPWENRALGKAPQITSNPIHDGVRGAKFPTSSDRVIYQEIYVKKNTDYVLTYYYTMNETGTGNMTMRILGQAIQKPSQVEGATIASYVGTDQNDKQEYVKVSVPFNSGKSKKIGIYGSNEGVESRVDSISITVVE
ncbi:hypothetical protein N9L20_01765 [Flavobacteriaceae bacterium]|nr:hypothetical protein [Flavobacteriaceae bacterium]